MAIQCTIMNDIIAAMIFVLKKWRFFFLSSAKLSTAHISHIWFIRLALNFSNGQLLFFLFVNFGWCCVIFIEVFSISTSIHPSTPIRCFSNEYSGHFLCSLWIGRSTWRFDANAIQMQYWNRHWIGLWKVEHCWWSNIYRHWFLSHTFSMHLVQFFNDGKNKMHFEMDCN